MMEKQQEEHSSAGRHKEPWPYSVSTAYKPILCDFTTLIHKLEERENFLKTKEEELALLDVELNQRLTDLIDRETKCAEIQQLLRLQWEQMEQEKALVEKQRLQLKTECLSLKDEYDKLNQLETTGMEMDTLTDTNAATTTTLPDSPPVSPMQEATGGRKPAEAVDSASRETEPTTMASSSSDKVSDSASGPSSTTAEAYPKDAPLESASSVPKPSLLTSRRFSLPPVLMAVLEPSASTFHAPPSTTMDKTTEPTTSSTSSTFSYRQKRKSIAATENHVTVTASATKKQRTHMARRSSEPSISHRSLSALNGNISTSHRQSKASKDPMPSLIRRFIRRALDALYANDFSSFVRDPINEALHKMNNPSFYAMYPKTPHLDEINNRLAYEEYIRDGSIIPFVNDVRTMLGNLREYFEKYDRMHHGYTAVVKLQECFESKLEKLFSCKDFVGEFREKFKDVVGNRDKLIATTQSLVST